jgi:hypothetical protein
MTTAMQIRPFQATDPDATLFLVGLMGKRLIVDEPA